MGFEYAGGELVPFFALASEKVVEFPQKTIDAFIKKIFMRRPATNGGVAGVDKEMFQETYNQFSDAIKTGFGEVEWGTPDWILNQNLKYNAATFAAFKNHSETKEIQKLLLDGDKVRKWEDFRDQALQISEKYNRRWLQTEYNHATQSSRMARKWQDAVADADLYPNLQYVTSGDERVRHSHAALNGAIYPINDPFWNTHFPPNGWGCRCTVRPTDKPAKQAAGLIEMPTGFDNNSGKSGMLFTRDMAYFKGASKAEKAYLDNVVGKSVRKPEEVKKHWEKYKAYGKEWKQAGFNYDNGGYNVYHKDHQFSKNVGGKAEKEVGKILMDINGKQVEFSPEKGLFEMKPDLSFAGQTWDVKSIYSANVGTIRKDIINASKKAENVIFIFDKSDKLVNLHEAINREIGNFKSKNKRMPGVWFINEIGELTKI